MIRRFGDTFVAIMMCVTRIAYRGLNNRRSVLRSAKAGARGVARAQEQRGDHQKHLFCGADHDC